MAISPTLNSEIRVNEDVLFQDLHGEGVLLNLKTGVYFGLDPVGTRVWQLLGDHPRLSAIVEALTAEYEIAEGQCAADLLALVADFEKHALVTIK